MNSKGIALALALVLTSSASWAQLRPTPPDRPGNSDPGRPGQYVPPPRPPGGGGPGGGNPPPHGGPGGGGFNPPPHGGGGGFNPPPNNPPPHGGPGGGGFPPPHGGGGGFPPPHGGPGGGGFPPPHGGGGYYPPPPPPHHPPHNPPPPPYYPPAPPYNPPPPPPPAPGQRIAVPVSVGRAVQDEMFQLSYYANLSAYYGWKVTAVRANTRPNSPYRTVVSLVDANRSVWATQTNPGTQVALFPANYPTAGVQDLYLWVQGSTYIDTIEVELQR